MKQDLSQFDIQHLQGRLQAAESYARTALRSAKEENPLYEPVRKLLAVHQEIRDLLEDGSSASETENEMDQRELAHAAVQIKREEHTLKADAMDVLKALFMWRDSPEEKVGKA
jgi:hypothetical protein